MRSGIVEQRHGRACSGTGRCGCPWSYRVDAPEAIDGKRRQVRKGGYPTKTAAREALADVQRRMAKGEEVGGSVTVASYLEDWLKAKATAGRSASTLAQYRIYVDNYLSPVLGHVRLADLRAKHVDGLLAKMQSEGRGLPTQHRVLAALSSALSAAERRRLVSSNVCRQVEIAPERTPTRPVYDGKQARRVPGPRCRRPTHRPVASVRGGRPPSWGSFGTHMVQRGLRRWHDPHRTITWDRERTSGMGTTEVGQRKAYGGAGLHDRLASSVPIGRARMPRSSHLAGDTSTTTWCSRGRMGLPSALSGCQSGSTSSLKLRVCRGSTCTTFAILRLQWRWRPVCQ
jgi:hypothetical protein